jgi:hypothetical protein
MAEMYRQIFGKQPDNRRPDEGSTSGALLGMAGIIALGFIIWFFAFMGSAGSQNNASPRQVQATSPTRAYAVAVLSPTPTATSRPTATTALRSTVTAQPTGTVVGAIEGDGQSSAGKLRESTIRPTPKPTSQVVMNAHGHDWVQYSSSNISVLYPNGWRIEGDPVGIFVASEDYSLDLTWSNLEDDISWLFERDNQQSTVMQSLVEDMEQGYIDDITENLGEIVQFDRFEQAELGGMPTVGGYVYELEVANNWEDGDTLYIGYGNVLCGPSRLCHFEYQKIDEPFTERDWAILDAFAGSVEFKQ